MPLHISNPPTPAAGASLISYGGLLVSDGSTPQTVDLAAAKLTGFTTATETRMMTVSAANDNITIVQAGVYIGMVQTSFSGSANTTFEIHLYVNGAEQDEGAHRKIGVGVTDVGSMSFSIPPKTLAVGDVLDVRINNEEADGRSVTLADAQFTLFRVL